MDVLLDLNKLRRQRTRMIWTAEQYCMVYRAVQSLIISVGPDRTDRFGRRATGQARSVLTFPTCPP